jgi:hypothetical protein
MRCLTVMSLSWWISETGAMLAGDHDHRCATVPGRG